MVSKRGEYRMQRSEVEKYIVINRSGLSVSAFESGGSFLLGFLPTKKVDFETCAFIFKSLTY
jgi:hypothetical protein